MEVNGVLVMFGVEYWHTAQYVLYNALEVTITDTDRNKTHQIFTLLVCLDRFFLYYYIWYTSDLNMW